MAGRSYNVSAASVPKTETDDDIISQDQEASEQSSVHKKRKRCKDIDDMYEFRDDTLFTMKTGIWCSILAAAAFFTGVAVYLAAVYLFDFGNGALSSRDLVTSVAAYFDDFSYDSIASYLPRSIRKSGFIADTEEFAAFRRFDAQNGCRLDKAVIDQELDFDDTASLAKQFYDMYGVDVPISGAKLTAVNLNFYDQNEQPVVAKANLISIKIRTKWYFYTGPVVDVKGEPLAMLTVQDKKTEVTSEETPDIEYVRPMRASEEEDEEIPEEPELTFSDSAEDDLIAGQMTIDGVAHTMPDLFASFNDIIVLDEDALAQTGITVISPDETVTNLPVSFAEETYADVPFSITVGNFEADSIRIPEGNVTGLYVGKPEEGEAPAVVLPGGVSFNTRISDVQKMYPSVSEVRDDEVFEGTMSDTVYAVSLTNSHNKIYFGFRSGKLAEIQWYYIDMTNYREI